MFWFMALLATVGTSTNALLMAPPSSASRHTRSLLSPNNNAFFAAGRSDKSEITTASNDSGEDECGDGFYKQTGPDGDFCVFDYDAAAKAFGTNEQVGKEYWEALDSQNRAREKFGMDPLTPEQYVALQAQIHQMDRRQIAVATERAFSEIDTNQDGVITAVELKEGLETILGMEISEQQIDKVMKHFDTSGDGLLQLDEFVTMDKLRSKLDTIAAEEEQASQGEQEPPGILQHFMNNMFQDTCESNFDCERPEVCCDFKFKKMCCSSGQMSKDLQLEYATVPVPQNASS